MPLWVPGQQEVIGSDFELDTDSPLVYRLKFAGLGGKIGSSYYHNSSVELPAAASIVGTVDWRFARQINRPSIYLDGSNNLISLGYPLYSGYGSAFTLSAFLKDGFTGIQHILSNDTSTSTRVFQWRTNGYNLELVRFQAGGGLIETVAGTFATGSAPEGFHHFAVTFSTSRGTVLYFDGEVVGTSSNLTANRDAVHWPAVGVRSGTQHLEDRTGSVADPCWWYRELSRAEIRLIADPSQRPLIRSITPTSYFFIDQGGAPPATTIPSYYLWRRRYA